MARVLWPGEAPLGKCFRVRDEGGPCRVVVGVAEDIKRSSLTEEQPFQYYLPWRQYPGGGSGLFVRTGDHAAGLATLLQRQLQELVPPRALVRVDPLQSRLDLQVQSWQLGATMFTLFGMVALVLTALGLFSVISYGVAQRRHEFSVRMALGATRADVRGLILRQGLGVATAGIMLGLLMTLAAGRHMEPLLFDVSPRSPAVLGAVACTLFLVALVGSAVPAVVAGRTPIGESLRSE
jgi:putative ABC transport system permease protein